MKYNALFMSKKDKSSQRDDDGSSLQKTANQTSSPVMDDIAAHSQDDVSQRIFEQSPSALSSLEKEAFAPQPKASNNEELEIGYFHLLNCDIKSTEDMIRYRYLEKTQDIIQTHKQSKMAFMAASDHN